MFHDAITEFRIGRTIGPYRVLQRIGIGGMGTVYRAEDVRLGRHVALKFLASESWPDDRALRRFDQEARSASSLNHPNICTIHEVGDDAGTPFIVMELLEGESLRQRLVKGPIPLASLLDLAIPIADALDLVHERGLIHRDLTPANIFITARGVPKLLDFGLATVAGARGDDRREGTYIDESDVSGPQFIVGTPGYMSPEQLRGLPLDARSDLFSLGAVLYEMAVGHAAFASSTTGTRLERVLAQAPERLEAMVAEHSPGLGVVIAKALNRDPDYRYQSARTFLVDLRQLKDSVKMDSQPALGISRMASGRETARRARRSATCSRSHFPTTGIRPQSEYAGPRDRRWEPLSARTFDRDRVHS
jgi:serine/threonine protein kinase